MLRERINFLAASILGKMEARHGLNNSTRRHPERVKELRQKIIQLSEKCESTQPQRQATMLSLSRDMDDLFVVMQLFSYPGDYLHGNPTVERLAETLDKFEEDVLGKNIPTVRGRRRVEICFGPPAFSSLESREHGNVTDLSNQIQARVQELLTELGGNGDVSVGELQVASAAS